MIYLIFGVFFFNDADKEFEIDTGLEVLTRSYIVCTKNMEFFVYDYYFKEIKLLSSTGALITTVGRKGEGPGEFASPYALSIVGDKLFVKDVQKHECFNLDGTFVKTFKNPFRVIGLSKMKQGWLGLLSNGKTERQIIWYDANLEEKEIILEITFDMPSQKKSPKQISLIPQMESVKISNQNNVAFIKFREDSGNIWVFNEDTRQLKTINVPGKPKPLNNDLAQTIKEYYLANYPDIKRNVDKGMDLFYPEFFPLIMNFDTSFDNRLIVEKWNPAISLNPKTLFKNTTRIQEYKQGDFIVYDESCKIVEPSATDFYSHRVISTTTNWIYYFFKDNTTDTYKIKRVAPQAADIVLKKIVSDESCITCPAK